MITIIILLLWMTETHGKWMFCDHCHQESSIPWVWLQTDLFGGENVTIGGKSTITPSPPRII